VLIFIIKIEQKKFNTLKNAAIIIILTCGPSSVNGFLFGIRFECYQIHAAIIGSTVIILLLPCSLFAIDNVKNDNYFFISNNDFRY